MIRENIKKNMWEISVVAVVAGFPVFFQWLNNVEDSNLGQVILSFIFVKGGALAAFGLFFLIYRDRIKTAFMTSIGLLLFWNYNIIETVIKFIYSRAYYWHILIVSLFFLIAIGYTVFFIKNKQSIIVINQTITIAFSGLILFNILIGTVGYVQLIKKNSSLDNLSENTASTMDTNSIAVNLNLPSVYLFIFDEFSSDNFRKKYYDHDNTEFRTTMQEKGFSYSMTSQYNYGGTSYGVPSVLNMEYPEVLSVNFLQDSFKNGKVFFEFKKNGYEIVNKFKHEPQELNNFGRILWDKSMIGKMLFTGRQYDKAALNMKEQINTVINFNYSKTLIPKFVFNYFQIPHAPYLFDKNGQRIVDSKALDFIDPAPYYNQYLYVQTVMLEIVDKIIAEDPDSIIILCSDHSMRFMYTYYDANYPDYGEVFNAVYFRGKKLPFELEGLDPCNTMRQISNEVLGTKLDLLEEVYGK